MQLGSLVAVGSKKRIPLVLPKLMDWVDQGSIARIRYRSFNFEIRRCSITVVGMLRIYFLTYSFEGSLGDLDRLIDVINQHYRYTLDDGKSPARR
jgi:hypothetical protein